MDKHLVDRLAFVIQDESMSRQEARRLVQAVLEALTVGDRVGDDLVIGSRSVETDRALESCP